MSYLLIVGAKSDIAKALARKYAKYGYDLYLAARNCTELNGFANDIRVRTQQSVKLLELDILDFNSHQKLYHTLEEKPVGVISAVGYMPEQEIAQSNFEETKRIIDTNYTGVVSFLNIVANDFEKRKSGFIIGISSVAGDRGRKSNYIYGSSKAGLTAFLSGLRNRLHDAGIHVMTVKPGFVCTKMTKSMTPLPLISSKPELVAKDIFNAQRKGKNVLYTKWIWVHIMLVIKLIPEKFFKRTNI